MLKSTYQKKRKVVNEYMLDLTEGCAREDYVQRANLLKELHDKYVLVPNIEESLKDTADTINEHTRERKHLQKNVSIFQRRIEQQKNMNDKHYNDKASESAALLGDYNRLHKENRILQKRLDALENDFQTVSTNLEKVKAKKPEPLPAVRTNRQLRRAETTSNLMNIWVKEKAKITSGSTFGAPVTKGKHLHSNG